MTDDTPAPLMIRDGTELYDAIGALEGESEDSFFATFGRYAMRLLHEHVQHLRHRGMRAAEVAKTAKGIKRRRAKEMKHSADTFFNRVMERLTGITIEAFSMTTGREVIFVENEATTEAE